MPTPEKVTLPINGSTVKLVTQLDIAMKEFAEVERKNHVELDVFYFAAYVPFFARDTEQPYETTLEKWVAVAGSPFNEVDIVKVTDGKKEVLFTVPPVLNRNMIKSTNNEAGEPSIYGAVMNTNNITNHSAAHAEMYLRNYLNKRQIRMWAPDTMMENAETWNKIFAYFGRPPMVVSIAGHAGKNSEANDEVVGFDPL